MTTSIQQQQQVVLGTMLLRIDDEDFLCGYTNGYETFHAYHHKEDAVDTSTLLFLLRNGWNAGHTDQWMTGYILRWLAAFYEQEDGQFALSMDAPTLCNPEREKEEESA